MIRNALHPLHLTQISEPCIADLADFMVKTTEAEITLGMKKGPVNSHLEDDAKITAGHVEAIVMGERGWTAADIKEGVENETPDPVWSILAKHDPDHFSLEHLERTQAVNSLRLDVYERESRGKR